MTKKVWKVREPGVRYITATELKVNPSEIINEIYFSNKTAIVEKHGKPFVRITRADDPTNTDEDALYKAWQKYAGSMPDFPDVTKMRSPNRKAVTL